MIRNVNCRHRSCADCGDPLGEQLANRGDDGRWLCANCMLHEIKLERAPMMTIEEAAEFDKQATRVLSRMRRFPEP